MSTWSSAVSASASRPGPTSSPASRSTRPNVTTWRTSASAGSAGLRQQADQRFILDELDVLVILEHRPERGLDQRRVELAAAQRGKRLGPVDRLGHAGLLDEV